MAHDKSTVRRLLDKARAAGRSALTAPQARGACEAYAIAIPKEGLLARSAAEAARLAADIGFPKYRWARGAGLIPAA
jgi:acyl-CoA synthetase (NDP forming)